MTSENNVIGNVYCPDRYGCSSKKIICTLISTEKTHSYYECPDCDACCRVLNIPFKHQQHVLTLFGGGGTFVFEEKTQQDYENEKPSRELWNVFKRKALPKKEN